MRFSDEESDDDAGQAIQAQVKEEERLEVYLHRYDRACKTPTAKKSTAKKVNGQEVNGKKINGQKKKK